MTKRGFLGAAAAVLSVAAVGAIAAAQTAPTGGDEPRPAGRGGRGARLADYLGLTDQQKAEWRTLREQQREQMKPVREEGRALRQKLREAMNAPSPDPKAVGDATLALQAHHKKVQADRDAFHQKLEGVLDPAQKEKLKAFEAARGWDRGMGRGFEGRGMHRGQRQPPAPEG